MAWYRDKCEKVNGPRLRSCLFPIRRITYSQLAISPKANLRARQGWESVRRRSGSAPTRIGFEVAPRLDKFPLAQVRVSPWRFSPAENVRYREGRMGLPRPSGQTRGRQAYVFRQAPDSRRHPSLKTDISARAPYKQKITLATCAKIKKW